MYCESTFRSFLEHVSSLDNPTFCQFLAELALRPSGPFYRGTEDSCHSALFVLAGNAYKSGNIAATEKLALDWFRDGLSDAVNSVSVKLSGDSCDGAGHVFANCSRIVGERQQHVTEADFLAQVRAVFHDEEERSAVSY